MRTYNRYTYHILGNITTFVTPVHAIFMRTSAGGVRITYYGAPTMKGDPSGSCPIDEETQSPSDVQVTFNLLCTTDLSVTLKVLAVISHFSSEILALNAVYLTLLFTKRGTPCLCRTAIYSMRICTSVAPSMPHSNYVVYSSSRPLKFRVSPVKVLHAGELSLIIPVSHLDSERERSQPLQARDLRCHSLRVRVRAPMHAQEWRHSDMRRRRMRRLLQRLSVGRGVPGRVWPPRLFVERV